MAFRCCRVFSFLSFGGRQSCQWSFRISWKLVFSHALHAALRGKRGARCVRGGKLQDWRAASRLVAADDEFDLLAILQVLARIDIVQNHEEPFLVVCSVHVGGH